MSRRSFFISAVLILFLSLQVFSVENLVFDRTFFNSFVRMNSLQREIFLEDLTNRIVIGRGTVLTVVERENYKKQYRIEVLAGEASPLRMKFIYYVYFDDKNIIDLLTEEASFEFKGQLMGITPLNTARSEFILDVVLMEGSTIID
jgi:hypothetical protein